MSPTFRIRRIRCADHPSPNTHSFFSCCFKRGFYHFYHAPFVLVFHPSQSSVWKYLPVDTWRGDPLRSPLISSKSSFPLLLPSLTSPPNTKSNAVKARARDCFSPRGSKCLSRNQKADGCGIHEDFDSSVHAHRSKSPRGIGFLLNLLAFPEDHLVFFLDIYKIFANAPRREKTFQIYLFALEKSGERDLPSLSGHVVLYFDHFMPLVLL